MQRYKRTHATNFGIGDSIDEIRRHRPDRPERLGFNEPIRLSVFDDWRELSTSATFQLHRLSDEATKVLRDGTYGLAKASVKALLVERIHVEGGEERFEVVGISIKFPSTPAMRRRRGLLVYAYADQSERAPQVGEAGIGFLPVPAPGGLYMTQTLRVLSLTRFHARLCLTGRIEQSCSWGAYDRLTGGDERPPSKEDLDALGTLSP